MKAYSKKEPKFTRAQLIFVVDVMITSAIDAIDASLPFKGDISRNNFDGMVNGIKEKLGFDLSIFYAQITKDGIGCCDVMEMTDMENVLADFIDEDKKVNTTQIATKFVNDLFKGYLSNGVYF
jgi:hypothetical protein